MNPTRNAAALALCLVLLTLSTLPGFASWQVVTNGLPTAPTISRISTDGSLAAMLVTSSSTGPTGVFLSTNGGNSWFKAAGNLPGSGQIPVNILVVSNTVYVSRNSQSTSGNAILRSSNYGVNWLPSTGFSGNTSIDLLAFDGTQFFAGKSGNGVVWRSSDGIDWSPVSSQGGSFNNGTVRALGGSNERAIAATTSGIYVLSGSGTNWLRASGDGNVPAVTQMASHLNRTLMLYGDTGRRSIAILDGVTNVIDATNGLPQGTATVRDVVGTPVAAFLSAQVLTPSFTFDAHIYQTTNGGSNWTLLPTPLVAGSANPSSLCIVSNTLFLGMGSPYGLYRVSLVDGVPFFPPTISGLGGTIGVHAGTNVVLNAAVSGEGPITVQWRKDGVDLPGETGPALTLSNVETNDSGAYTLVATNPGGSTTSSATMLIVVPRTPGAPNLDFQPGYFASESFGGSLFNGTPFAVAVQTNGQVIVAGNFTHVNAHLNSDGFSFTNGIRRGGVARLNADGSADLGFTNSPGISAFGSVRTVLIQPDGKILLGGEFTSYNGVPQTNITRIHPDGALDESFVANSFNNGANIWNMALQSDGKILIVGSFGTINGQTRLGAARLLSNGALDLSWPTGTGVGGSVNDVVVLPGDDSLFGGSFSSVNGETSRKYLARFDVAGGLNTLFGHGLNSSVSDMELQPGGLVWVGGHFSSYSNAPISSVVRLNATGGLVGTVNTSLSNPSGFVSQEDGKLILTHYRSATFDHVLARFNGDGTLDASFNAGSFSIAPQDMTMSRSGDLFAVGTFSTYYGLPFRGMVKIYGTSNNVPAEAPEFLSEPADVAALLGQNVILSGSVNGVLPISFLWLKDGALLDGFVSSSLTLSNLAPEQLGGYQLVASNSFGVSTSRVAMVSAAAPPTFTLQPPAITGSTSGGSVVIPVEVAGTTPLGFQWYRQNGLQHGLTNNPLVLSNLNAGLTGNWFVVVSNAFGRATSSIVNVQIGTAPSITGQPSNRTLNGEGDVTLQVITSVSGSLPLTYLWYQNNTFVRELTTNSYVHQLVISNAVPSDSGSYHVVITNFAGSVTSVTRTVTVRNPFFAQPPVSITALQGTSTNFTAGASGTAPISYHWYRRTFGFPSVTNFLGTGPTLAFPSLTRADGQHNYFVVASNIWGSVTSSLNSITVQFPIAITNISTTNITAELNSMVSFFVQYEAQPHPDIRWYKDGVLQGQLFNASVFFNSVQASNGGTYQLVLSNVINAVTSAPIVLTVKPPRGPEITNQPPATRIASTAGTLSIPVGVDGTPILYFRWYRGAGTPVSGWQTAAGLSLSSLTTNDSGDYYVIVTNAFGSATSSVSAVTIIAPQQPTFGNKRFVKIADTLTIAPGLSALRFSSFRDAFIRGGQVWFGANAGTGVGFSAGVYHWNGNSLSRLVDTNTLVPGTSSRFTNFYGSTFLSDNKVVFVGYGSNDEHGIYAWTNGSVITIHDRSTVMPGRPETFDRFGWPAVFGSQFAFLGFSGVGSDSYRGVYVSSNGILTKLADTNNALPGLGGHFRLSSSQVGFDGNKVAWWAINEDDKGGIFTVTRALALTNVADESTINPATGNQFDGFISPPNVHTGRVYFVGHDVDFNTSMLYRDGQGPIQVVAKPGDVIPGRGMTFDSVGYPFQIGGSAGLFFDGQDGTGYNGIYYWNGSSIAKVIDSLDSLDGSPITFVFVADAEGDNLVFYVGFTNGRQALYALVSKSGQSFSTWAGNYSFPPGQSDPDDDADGDGIKNAFEFYFGSNPTSAASGAMPGGTMIVSGGQTFPAITFIRSKAVGGVTMIPQAATDLAFSTPVGTVVESVVDLGNETERVTIRSTLSSSAQPTQFLRILLEL